MSNDEHEFDINDLKQFSQLMSSDTSVKQIQSLNLPQQKIAKKVKILTPPVSENSDQLPQQKIKIPSQKNETNSDQLIASPNFELMGYVVNKQTIYLLIVLIIIAAGLWYVSSDSPKKKEKKDDKEEENE
jgi:hypothetical protein